MSDPADEPVRLVASDPDWPARFESERALLEAAIGEWAVGGIHHVGSTAVPGLEAKPIIDILVGVSDLELLPRLLRAPGRARVPLRAVPGRPDALVLQARSPAAHPPPSSRSGREPPIRDEIAFRDLLRSDQATAAEYLALKRRLAAEFEHDRDGYTDAKAEFIAAALS